MSYNSPERLGKARDITKSMSRKDVIYALEGLGALGNLEDFETDQLKEYLNCCWFYDSQFYQVVPPKLRRFLAIDMGESSFSLAGKVDFNLRPLGY